MVMVSKSETTALKRALVALVTAIDEMDDALVKLALGQDQNLQDDVNKSLLASREARNQCLEQLLIFTSEGRE